MGLFGGKRPGAPQNGCRALLLVLLSILGALGLISPASADTGTRRSAFTYNSTTGLLATEVIEPGTPTLELTTTYTRDAFGNILTATVSGSGITSRTTTTTYDTKGQFPESTANALNQTATATYDPRFGSLTSATDPNGVTATTTYDAFGRKASETAPDGTKTLYTYKYCNGVAGGTEPCPANGAYKVFIEYRSVSGLQNGPSQRVFYDQLGRVIDSQTQVFSSLAVHEETLYDDKGRVTQKSEPYKSGSTVYWTLYSYDALGRVVDLTDPEGAHATYSYNGLVTAETNFNGQDKTTTRNAQGKVVTVKDDANKITSYDYDAFGNLLSTTDPAGNVISATYDIRGRKITADDPDMGAWSYSYDVLGQLKSQTDAKGQVTSLSYDLLGRLTRKSDGRVSTWTYDTAANGIGKLATAVTYNYRRSYAYDALGRPNETTTNIYTQTVTTTIGYDTDTGRVSGITYPSGFMVQYVYNVRGYLAQVRDALSGQLYWQVDGRNARGQATQATAGNGVVTKWSYSETRGFTTVVRAGPGNAVANFNYSYDALGNLLTRGDLNESLSETFGYDNRNRLTSYTVNGTTKTVTYNDIGNILTKSDVGTYSYPAAGGDRPHAVSGITPSGSGTVNTTFAYDANGNMTSGKGRTVTWTGFNMVDQITMGGTTASFVYDGENNRIRQVSTAGTTLYYWDPALAMPAEKEQGIAGAATWKEYIVVDGKAVAQHVTALDSLGMVTSTQLRYFVTDPLGSIAVITDEAGAVTERLSYDAWGKRRYPNGSDDPAGTLTGEVSRGFTGHEMLDEVGLVHMNGRIYDPQIGRFLSADPNVADVSDAQSLNRYSYVNNNPLSYTDPSGYFLKKLIKSVGKLFKSIAQGLYDLITHPRQLFALVAAAALMYALTPAVGIYVAAGISGGVAGAISTGSAMGVLMGAVTAVAFAGIGDLQNIGAFGALKRAGLKGLVGGTVSYISGGKFQAGFLSAGAAGLAGGYGRSYLQIDSKDYLANVAFEGTIGGVAAELGGGKFSNGFATGSFNYLFNDLAHMFIGQDAHRALFNYLGRREDSSQWSFDTGLGLLSGLRPDILYDLYNDEVNYALWELKPAGQEELALAEAKMYVQEAGSYFSLGNNSIIFGTTDLIFMVDSNWWGGRVSYTYYRSAYPGVITYSVNEPNFFRELSRALRENPGIPLSRIPFGDRVH